MARTVPGTLGKALQKHALRGITVAPQAFLVPPPDHCALQDWSPTDGALGPAQQGGPFTECLGSDSITHVLRVHTHTHMHAHVRESSFMCSDVHTSQAQGQLGLLGSQPLLGLSGPAPGSYLIRLQVSGTQRALL